MKATDNQEDTQPTVEDLERAYDNDPRATESDRHTGGSNDEQ